MVWDPLITALAIDGPVLVQLPGFGCELPDGFDATMDGYADWLTGELHEIEEPVDLVTHDWGALLAVRVLAQTPGIVRSWVTDMGDLTDDFAWHDTARTWQTPGDGEAFMDGFLGASDADRGALLVGLGIDEAVAMPMATQIDRTMCDAILSLYRSATAIGPQWGPGIDRIATPTLVVDAEQDPFRTEGSGARLAQRVGGQVAPIGEAGHWWMTTHPAESAAAIGAFWSGLV